MREFPVLSLRPLPRSQADTCARSYSARFRAHLASNQIPFKSTVFPEWYAGRIEPWVHYVRSAFQNLEVRVS